MSKKIERTMEGCNYPNCKLTRMENALIEIKKILEKLYSKHKKGQKYDSFRVNLFFKEESEIFAK